MLRSKGNFSKEMKTVRIKWKCQINTVKETMLLISLSGDSTQPRKKLVNLKIDQMKISKKKKNREKKEEANKGNNHPKSVEQIKWANIYVTGIPEVEE